MVSGNHPPAPSAAAARGLEKQLESLTSAQYIGEFLSARVVEKSGRMTVEFTTDQAAYRKLKSRVLGKRVLFTANPDLTDDEIVFGYRGQHHVERVMNWADTPWIQVGFLVSYRNFKLEREGVGSGAYIVFLTPQTISLFGSREMTDQYGNSGPHMVRHTIPLPSKIDASLLTEKAAKRPRFSLLLEDQGAILRVEANKLKIGIP